MDQVSLTSVAVLFVKVEAFMVRGPSLLMAPPLFQEKEDRGNCLVSEMVGLAQSEVYTHSVCSVALKGAAIDVECPYIVVDGPSLVPVSIQVVLHVQIFRAQRQLCGLEGMCGVCGEHAAERTYSLMINQSCHPVCWSFQFCMEYMTHTNHFMLEHHIQAVQNPGEGGQRQLFGQ
jgi:hypothetical protein